MKYLRFALLTALFVTVPAIAEDKKTTPERPETGKSQEAGKESAKRRNRKKPGDQWRILKNIPEEEHSRLRKLYESDPATFRKEVAKIVSRLRQKEKERDQQVKNLVQKYKTAKTPDDKKAAYEALRKLTREVFMEKMENNRKRLESLEKHVKKFRQQYEFRKKNAEKIIQARLDALTNNMEFDW